MKYTYFIMCSPDLSYPSRGAHFNAPLIKKVSFSLGTCNRRERSKNNAGHCFLLKMELRSKPNY